MLLPYIVLILHYLLVMEGTAAELGEKDFSNVASGRTSQRLRLQGRQLRSVSQVSRCYEGGLTIGNHGMRPGHPDGGELLLVSKI